MADPGYIVDGVLTDGEAWVGIAHAAVSLPAATVTFTSTDDGQTGDFSQYMDLVIVVYARTDDASWPTVKMYVNNITTGALYTSQLLYGDGSAASASSATYNYGGQWNTSGSSEGANIFGCCVYNLFDINSGKYKSMTWSPAGDRDGSGYVGVYAGTVKTQAPITEIDLTGDGDDFVAGCTFSLFGVLPRMVA